MEIADQLKLKAEKLYNSKAENHFKSLKEVTSVPKIDPLSRKIAEIVTRKELEVLGIKTTEGSIKKPYYSASLLETTQKAIANNPVPNLPKGMPIQLTPEPKPEIKLLSSVLSPIIVNPKKGSELVQPLDPNNPDQPVEKIQKSEEMLNNLEHLNAFKEELHRDYPELGLNNSGEGSSFHTNELNELEEACKDLAVEKPASCPAILVMKNEERVSEFASNMTEYGSLRANELNQAKAPSLSSSKQPESRDEKSNLMKMSRNKSDGCIVHSKQFSISSEYKDFVGLQQSYFKASFLHSVQEPVEKAVPRCHIDLLTTKASPIYFNVRVSKDAKVKNPNGIGPADCLRKLLLKPPPVESITDRGDIYSRSAKWVTDRKEKTMRLRELKNSESMQNSTFDPSYKKNERTGSLSSNSNSFNLSQPSISASNSSHSYKTGKNTLKYLGLSPAVTEIRHVKGVDREKFREKAKPLVNYRQVNFLK